MTDFAPALNSEPAALADSDYDSILSAVMETARGRWFLHEYVRRNRNADTGTLLAAIDRIESLLKARESEIIEAVDTATGIDSTPPGILGIVMQLRDIAENLIECGAPTYLCNDLVRRIEELALVCSQTDAAVPEQATQLVRPETAQVEAALVEGPQAEIAQAEIAEIEVAQVEVTQVEVAEVEIVEVTQFAEVEVVTGETPRDPFADILALSPEERIALFS